MSVSRLIPNSKAEKKVFIFSALFAFALLICDQATKLWIEQFFLLHESRPVIDNFLSITSVRNLGAAWSIFSGHGILLALFSIAVSIGIILFFRKLAEGYSERYYALSALLAGITGNAIDRIFRGCVVDFIDVHYCNIWQYPIFNVADMAICCSMAIYILSTLLRKTPEKDEKKC